MRWLAALLLLIGCGAGPAPRTASPSGQPAAGGETPARPVREAAVSEAPAVVRDACARGDARIDLSHLYVEIEARILPMMRDAEYLGFAYDSTAMAYRLKFIRKGHVLFVDVDARTGKIVQKSW